MQTIIRKVYLSIMVSILCMITLVTSTFAWIGFLNFSNFEKFEINLNGSELEEYGIEISLTGEDGTFGSSVNAIDLRKAILKNWGYTEEFLDSKSNDDILELFRDLNMAQCSVIPNDDKSFPDFVDMSNQITKCYFKFDIYISAFQAFDTGDDAEYYLDAYLRGDLLEGTKDTRSLVNKFTYPSDFINSASNAIPAGAVIHKNITVDSSSACRVAIQKYNVVDKYCPQQYDENSVIQEYIIYQGGSSMPTYDPVTGVYSFGGIMEDKYNLALYDYNTKYPQIAKTIPTELFTRGDMEYTPNVKIIDSSKPEEKIGINQMMKMTIYFWFEGWDADCFEVIDRNPVTLNLNFSTDNKD